MSYHIVSIDAANCSLSCRDGQLTCKTADGAERKLPLEDVASIIITSFSASIHSNLFLEAAKQGVALIICESFKPVSTRLTGFPLQRVDYLDLTLEIQGCIEGVVRGFRRAVIENQPRFYKPWTPKNSKWAG